MEAGLTVFNESGDMQINSNYFNLVLDSSTNIPAGQSTTTKLFESWNTKPIFAIRPDPNDKYALYFKSRDNNYEGSGTIYNFKDAAPNSTNNGFGLEVYRPDGTLSYSSNEKGMNVIDYVKLNISGNTNDFFSKNYGSTDIAVVPTLSPIGFSGAGQPGMVTAYGLAFKLSSTGVLSASMIGFQVYPEGIADYFGNTYKLEFLVIDTTGY